MIEAMVRPTHMNEISKTARDDFGLESDHDALGGNGRMENVAEHKTEKKHRFEVRRVDHAVVAHTLDFLREGGLETVFEGAPFVGRELRGDVPGGVGARAVHELREHAQPRVVTDGV